MKRRDFLRASAATGVLAAAGSAIWARKARAAFGEVPAEYQSLMLPEKARAQSVLELFMYGGVSPWETFYCSDKYGKAKKEWLYTFYEQTLAASQKCGYQLEESQLLTPFALDSSGQQIFLGPFVEPLRARPDVLDRMRIVINRHALEPHEAAIPLAISGKTLGSPSLASLGAHIQEYFVERETSSRTAPFAYGFATAGGFLPTDNVMSLVATGLHPGSARPLLVKVDNVDRLNMLLDRATVGSLTSRAKYDALLNVYFNQAESELRFKGAMPLRAGRFNELKQAATSVQGSVSVQEVLDPSLFEKEAGESCGETNDINVPAMSLRLAVHLLTHPTSPARHCCVVDTGLKEADGGGGYDTHKEMSFTQSYNLHNTLTNLLSRVNKPGEADATKIDLDKTMIILNQEFGRAPSAQNGGLGRNHWPYGYMQVYIGGPITNQQKGIYGAIEESGQATTFTTPTENRIASLLAMGIWPFDPAGFSNSDVQNQSEDRGAIIDVTKRVLGYQL